jgi:hypothetical protein
VEKHPFLRGFYSLYTRPGASLQALACFGVAEEAFHAYQRGNEAELDLSRRHRDTKKTLIVKNCEQSKISSSCLSASVVKPFVECHNA